MWFVKGFSSRTKVIESAEIYSLRESSYLAYLVSFATEITSL